MERPQAPPHLPGLTDDQNDTLAVGFFVAVFQRILQQRASSNVFLIKLVFPLCAKEGVLSSIASAETTLSFEDHFLLRELPVPNSLLPAASSRQLSFLPGKLALCAHHQRLGLSL